MRGHGASESALVRFMLRSDHTSGSLKMFREQMLQCAASLKMALLLPWLLICHLRVQWLTSREKRARLRVEAITRRRFHRAIAARERSGRR
jgi:hypothetical protein